MRKVILFIATSLDGFIAKKNGDIEWLFTDQDYGYDAFFSSIDTTIMGRITYDQIASFYPFPYQGKMNYVFTRNEMPKNSDVTFVKTPLIPFVKGLKEQQGKDVWLVGGGQINALLLENELIDQIIVSIHPIALGEGIPLFPGNAQDRLFKLKDTKSYDTGLVQLTYDVIPLYGNISE